MLEHFCQDEATSAGAGARVHSPISRDSDLLCHIEADFAHRNEEVLMCEQARAEMELVIAFENRGVLVVIICRNTVIRDSSDGLLGYHFGLSYDFIVLNPGRNIAHRELVLVKRLLENMRDSQ